MSTPTRPTLLDAKGQPYKPYWPTVTVTPPSGRFELRSAGLSQVELDGFRVVLQDKASAKYLPPRDPPSDEEVEELRTKQVIAPWDHRRTFCIWQGDDVVGDTSLNYLQFSPGQDHLPGPERPIALVECGIALNRAFAGKGIAKEAFVTVINFAFESMGVPLMRFGTEERNMPMRGILERAPLSLKPKEMLTLDAEQAKIVDEWSKHSLVMVWYDLTRDEWESRLRGSWRAHFEAKSL